MFAFIIVSICSLQKPHDYNRATTQTPDKITSVSSSINSIKNVKNNRKSPNINAEESTAEINAYILNNYAYSYDDSEEEEESKPLSKEELKQQKIRENIAKGAAKRAERARRKKEKAAQIEAPVSIDNAEVGLANLHIDESEVAIGGINNEDSANEDVGLGAFFETAETADNDFGSKDLYLGFHKDLSIHRSWTGRTPVEYLSYMIRSKIIL